MKTIKTWSYSKEQIKDLKEYIEGGGLTVFEDKDSLAIKENISISELFEIARDWGIETENSKHTKPEIIRYVSGYGKKFEECAKEYFRKEHISNNSIEFAHDGEDTKLTIIPTAAHHLIGIGTEYGKMLQKEEVAE